MKEANTMIEYPDLAVALTLHNDGVCYAEIVTDDLLDQEHRYIHESKLKELEEKNEYLKEQLKQLANFNPDWDILKATQESLREHMRLIKSIEEKLEIARNTIDACMYCLDKGDVIKNGSLLHEQMKRALERIK